MGSTVETTFSLSFSSLFYIHLSDTWRWIYPQKIPRGSILMCYIVTTSFLASFWKHYLDFLANLWKNSTFFRFCQPQWPTDSVQESRMKLHRIHLFVTWSTHIYNRWFLTRFQEHGVPSTWRWKIHELKKISLGLSWILQIEARNQNRLIA